jgi:hypothetical protein
MTGLLLCLALLTDPGLPSDAKIRGCGFAWPVAEAAEIYPLPPDVLLAQGQIESGWKPWLVGGSGERGAWQCLPRYSALSGAQLARPVPGMWEGARHLAYRLRESGDLRLALAAYNAGPAVYDPACDTKKCKRGRDYAVKVLALAARWR